VLLHRKTICRSAAAATLLGLLSIPALGQAKPNIDPIQLVRAAAKNEIRANDVQQYYMFKDAVQYKDHSTTKEIVRTPQGGLGSTILINGRPLTADERKKDNDRLQKFANDPEARRRRHEASKADDKRAELMLTSLPDAFLYTYVGTEHGENGDEIVHLKFKPNPSFQPPNHETAVYQGMEGDMLIDSHALRIARIDGTLFKDVDFGWGILGKLYKGGKFIIVQRDVGGGHWEEVEETLNFYGKILMVKSLTVWSSETMTDFRPVPSNLTTAQALELLHNADVVSAENANGGGGVKEAQNTHESNHK